MFRNLKFFKRNRKIKIPQIPQKLLALTYIIALDYGFKDLPVLSDAESTDSLSSFTTVIWTPVGRARASIGLVSLFLKTMGKKKINTKTCFIGQ